MNKSYCPYCLTKTDKELCPKCGLTKSSYKSASDELPYGTVLKNRYFIGRRLGGGGFGVTYSGYDMLFNKKVAIKEYFPKNLANRHSEYSYEVSVGEKAQARYKKGKDRFAREAQCMVRMNKQPEIADCMDFFEANGTAYIVMEFVDGANLKSHVLREGPMDAKVLLPLIEPVMRAVDNMHKEGLIHRDISPDNLILEKGRLRLIDFGCARDGIDGDATMTVMLKQGFSPVEQYQKKGQGPWTDVYALAATLYYCVAGRVPQQAVDRLLGDAVVLPTKLGADLTPSQEAAILKGMAVEKTNRFQTMEEFRLALFGETGKDSSEKTEPAPDKKEASEPVKASSPEENVWKKNVSGTKENYDEQGEKKGKLSSGKYILLCIAAAVLIILIIILVVMPGSKTEEETTTTPQTETETSANEASESTIAVLTSSTTSTTAATTAETTSEAQTETETSANETSESTTTASTSSTTSTTAATTAETTAAAAVNATATALEGTKGANSSELYGNLLDGSVYTKWCVTSFSSAYIIWEMSEAVAITGYKISTANDNSTYTGRNPTSWALYGANGSSAPSKDSSSWKLITSVSGNTTLQAVNYTTYTFTLSSRAASYKYYKLVITAVKSGSVMQMSEFTLVY